MKTLQSMLAASRHVRHSEHDVTVVQAQGWNSAEGTAEAEAQQICGQVGRRLYDYCLKINQCVRAGSTRNLQPNRLSPSLSLFLSHPSDCLKLIDFED